jgi:hypothetical protein
MKRILPWLVFLSFLTVGMPLQQDVFISIESPQIKWET